MTRRPTIIDVARRAGVSKSTVSLVLNDSALVVAPKREAVRKAMAELGYVYNRSAAKMRNRRVGLIGLVLNDLRNPFFTEYAAAAQRALAEQGYATVIANSNEDPATQRMVIASMIEHGVSAMMISPAYGDPDLGEVIAASGLPTLAVLRGLEGGGAVPFVSFDYAEGSRLAVQHLIDRNKRRIAFVGGLTERPVTLERMAGCGDRLGPGQAVAMALHGRPTRAFGREIAARLIAERVDAALCFNDFVALGVCDGLRDAGRMAGREMAVVGFDDIEEAAQARPPLTSVHCNIAAFGETVAGLILRWLNEGVVPQPELRLPVRLVVRDSSAA